MLITAYTLKSQDYEFRKPTLVGSSWKFTNVKSGIDAYITPIAYQNASINSIDDSTVYPEAWCPFIKIDTSCGATDTSYVEFKVEFKVNTTLDTQANIIATLVNFGGSIVYKEFVQLSQISTGKHNIFTTATWDSGSYWYLYKSGSINYSTIDTGDQDAMIETIQKNKSEFFIRIGTIGNNPANLITKNCLYFKHFDSSFIPLPLGTRNIVINPNEILTFYEILTGKEFFTGKMSDFLYLAEPGIPYFANKKKYIKQ